MAFFNPFKGRNPLKKEEDEDEKLSNLMKEIDLPIKANIEATEKLGTLTVYMNETPIIKELEELYLLNEVTLKFYKYISKDNFIEYYQNYEDIHDNKKVKYQEDLSNLEKILSEHKKYIEEKKNTINSKIGRLTFDDQKIYFAYYNYLESNKSTFAEIILKIKNIRKNHPNLVPSDYLDTFYETFDKLRYYHTTLSDITSKVGGNIKIKIKNKKNILGKERCIYKISGNRNEYVKHKGELITVNDYKKIIKLKNKK